MGYKLINTYGNNSNIKACKDVVYEKDYTLEITNHNTVKDDGVFKVVIWTKLDLSKTVMIKGKRNKILCCRLSKKEEPIHYHHMGNTVVDCGFNGRYRYEYYGWYIPITVFEKEDGE